MTSSSDNGHTQLRQRLGCLLAVSDSEADALIASGPAGVDTTAIARRVGLDCTKVERIVASRGAIESARIDVNALTLLQLQRVPGLPTARMRTVLEGQPYFSLFEFEEATGLPREQVADLFEVPDLVATDKTTGRLRRFEPVFGKFIVSPRLEFEAPSIIESLGFVERAVDLRAPIRVIVPGDAEAPPPSHVLKQALGGQVHPVLRDSEGFERYFVPGSIDVWFPRTLPSQRALTVLAEFGLRVSDSRPVGLYQAELVSYPADQHVAAAMLRKIDEIQTHADVAFAEPTEVGFQDFTPVHEKLPPDFEDAPLGNRMWNLQAINLAAAHAVTEGAENVTILLVDSGMRTEHQDLSIALRPDWSGLDLNFDLGVPETEISPVELVISHGTKVASVAGGRGPGGASRVRGVAPRCWLLPVKISGSPFGQSYGLRAAAIMEAIDYIAPDARGVINMSWSTAGEHIGIREALFEASDKGLAMVASAGNYSVADTQAPNQPHYPSGYAFLPGDTEADVQARRKIPGLASVAAVNESRRKSSYSYFGDKVITVSAPGGEPGMAGAGVFVASTPADYSYEAGTSFAAPHVAGLIALLWSAKPDLTAQDAIEVIRANASPLDADDPAHAGMLGAGLIDAGAALLSLGTLPDQSAPAAPTPPAASGMLDINAASRDDLIALPYIGDWSADVIVAYRAAHGKFATIWGLTLTGAVDHWTVHQIKHLITAG